MKLILCTETNKIFRGNIMIFLIFLTQIFLIYGKTWIAKISFDSKENNENKAFHSRMKLIKLKLRNHFDLVDLTKKNTLQ